jgi:hypothetical protein
LYKRKAVRHAFDCQLFFPYSGLATGVAVSKLDGAELLVGPGGFSIASVSERKRVLGF